MRIRVLTHAACAVAVVTAWALGTAVRAGATPASTMYVEADIRVEVQVTGVECPREDSCALDYRDGSWYVREL